MIMKRNEKGFTLIEVLISLAIIGILLIGLNTFMGYSYKIIHIKGEDTTILYAAQKELENAVANSTYVAQDNRLSIKRNNNYSINVNANSVKGTLIEVVNKSNSKTILSTFVPN